MNALEDISKDGEINYKAFSVCDDKPDTRYIKAEKHKGFRNRKISFAINSLFEGLKSDLVVIGHVNLAPVAILIKLLKPKIKMILVAHGVEIWNKQNYLKEKLLKRVDLIMAVSNFTKNKIIEQHKIPAEKITILHNTLDPYFKVPEIFKKPEYLLKRYNINPRTKVILTLTRIKKIEGYKGYDKVIELLPDILKEQPHSVYLLAGKYDEEEKKRIMHLAKKKSVDKYLIITGYIEDKELTDHYLLADVFVMPSTQEGFGIVFLEALACGLSVIAGNKDGSTDALLNGELGKLVDPDSADEIMKSIVSFIENPFSNKSKEVFENFGFNKFKKDVNEYI